MNNLRYLIKRSVQAALADKSFFAGVVVTMGITIGVFLVVLTLGFYMLLKPLSYPQQDELFVVDYQRINQSGEAETSFFLYPAAEALYRNIQSAKDIGVKAQSMLFFSKEVLTSEPLQPNLATVYTTASTADILGIPMAKGQWFAPAELGQRVPGAVITYQVWAEQFSLREDILGQKLVVNGVSHPVIGVIQADFVAPQLAEVGLTTQLWLPWDFNNSEYKEDWRNVEGKLFYLIKTPAASTGQLSVVLSAMTNEMFRKMTIDNQHFVGWSADIEITPLRSKLVAGNMTTVIFLLAGGLGLLLIATSNITNLFISRVVSKHKQLAIAATLGAKKKHLWLQMFSETLVLMLASSAVAILIALLGFGLIQRFFSTQLARAHEISFDWMTLCSALLVAVLLAFIISLLSIRIVNYRQLSQSLKSSGKGVGVQISSGVRNALLVSQISVAVVLIFCSASLIKNAATTLQRHVGFDSTNVLRLEFRIATLDWQGWDTYAPKVTEFRDKLAALPEVEAVTFARSPLEDIYQFALTYSGDGKRYYPFHRNVDHNYLDVVGQRLLSGQGFALKDVQSRTNVAMVSATFAEQLGHGDITSVIGKTLAIDSIPPATIIGVVEDLVVPSKAEIPPRFYVPNGGSALWLMLKLKPGTVVTREQVTALMRDTNNQFALTNFSSLQADVDRANFTHLVTLTVAGSLAIFTLLLAFLGLFGIISYGVKSRTTEFNIKMAIGAKYNNIFNETVRENISILMIGASLGTIFIIACLYFYYDLLSVYISISSMYMYAITIVAVFAVLILSSSISMRAIKKNSIVNGLKGIAA